MSLGPWVHSSGASLARGTVVRYNATQVELDALDMVHDQRVAWAKGHKPQHLPDSEGNPCACPRCVKLHATCEWLSGYGLDVLGTVTFSDDYAERFGIHSLQSAMRDVRRGLAQVPMKRNTRKGFPFCYVLTGEWHPSGRQVPHVHVALESGSMPVDRVCTELWTYFFATRGRSRFEPMRDTSRATLYGLKDTIKSAELDANWCVTRLHHPRVGRSRRRS